VASHRVLQASRVPIDSGASCRLGSRRGPLVPALPGTSTGEPLAEWLEGTRLPPSISHRSETVPVPASAPEGPAKAQQTGIGGVIGRHRWPRFLGGPGGAYLGSKVFGGGGNPYSVYDRG